MRRTAAFLIACILLSAVFPVAILFGQDSEVTKKLVRGNTQFALDLYQKLKTGDGNILFSPFSISTVGVLAYRGARGETARQLAATLHLSLPDEELFPALARLQAALDAIQKKESVELSIANSLWPQERYPFLQTQIIPVDFEKEPRTVHQKVNQWVEQNTQSRIKGLLPDPVVRLTRLLIVNAVYFKGVWVSRFSESQTREMSFFLNTETTVRVPMMSQGGGFNFREDKSVQVLEMPYTGKDLSMVILLPRERDGLRNLEDSLTADAMEKWTSGLFSCGIEVLVPKFTVTHRLTLDAVLKEMGVTDAFDPREADFSGMDGRAEWLNIGSILHQAFVIVDEEGTEAAAATSGGGCFPSGTVVLTADGARPIEKIESGTRVASCDPATGAWTLAS